jgi:sulfonate transport system substrate-binding protein
MKHKLAIIMALFAVFAFSANAASAEESKPKVIRIGSAYASGYGKPYGFGNAGVLQARGLLEEEFRKEGIKIEWYLFKGAGPAVNESLANKLLDFVYEGDLPAIVAKAGGLKTKLLAAGSKWANVYIAVPADSKISSIKDLRGKRVGVFKGTNIQLTLDRILEANGLKESDLRIYNLGTADLQNALKTKDVDAAVSGVNLFTLQSQGNSRIIYSTKTAPKDWRTTGAFYVTEDFAKKYPEITKRVVKDYVKASVWASDEANRNGYLQVGVNSGYSRADQSVEIAGRTLKDVNDVTLDSDFLNHLVGAIAISKQKGLIRNTYDLNTWVDRSYLDAALKELNLEHFWK